MSLKTREINPKNLRNSKNVGHILLGALRDLLLIKSMKKQENMVKQYLCLIFPLRNQKLC